ncbi:MAG: DUF2760 domain-containing protein [Fuerstiella sp.]
MGRLGLALKILFSSSTAQQVSNALANDSARLPATSTPDPETAAPKPPPAPKPPARSDAITLLSALQREARLVDFLKEPIDGYSDDQVGAAVREVHRGSREVIERMFAPVPIVDQPEESTVEVANPSSGKWRLTGNVSQSNSAVSGQLMHHGWKAGKCDVPTWSGDDDSKLVIAAAEVQIS